MAGASNSITTHNVLSGVLNADNVISGLVNTAFNPAYALVTQAGAQIVLFINSNDYKMYAQLKDKSGNLIYTSNIIDLPLETMVVDGRYDSNTKKLILVLDNGNEIEVPLEALINGLVNEDDLIANYYDKDEIDALLNGYWTKIELTQEDIDNWNAADAAFQSELFDDGVISIEDSTEANINNTMNKSQLKIGLKGNTSQESTTGINLFCPDTPSKTQAGITVTNNGDGTYTINGTATANLSIPLTVTSLGKELTGGQPYTMAMEILSNGGSGGSITVEIRKNGTPQYNFFVLTPQSATGMKVQVATPSEDATIGGIAYYCASGAVVNNLKIRPYLVKGSYTASNIPAYEPYTNGPAPNPDYPYPVNVVTGDNEVKIEGKNLFDVSKVNNLALSDTVVSNPTYRGYSLKVNSGDTYTISRKATTSPNRFRVCFTEIEPANKVDFYGESGIVQSYVELGSATSRTVTVPSGMNYMFLYLSNNNETITTEMEIQIEKGTQATPYQPYQSQTYPINLGSMELCKIGDYQDVIKRSSGKNLVNSVETHHGINGTTGAITTENAYLGIEDYVSCKPNTTYTISFQHDIPTAQLYVGYKDESGTFLERVFIGTTRTFTTPNNAYYMFAYVYYSNNFSTIGGYVMLNEGTTALPYEPYGKVWYKYGAIGKVVLDGSEGTWTSGSVSDNNIVFSTTIIDGLFNPAQNNSSLCNNFIYNGNIWNTDNLVGFALLAVSYALRMRLEKTRLSDTTTQINAINSFKTWLSTHNTTVYYVLATPTITPITDTTLIEQLDNLEKAYSYDTQTNISQINQDKSFILDINAIADNVNGLKLENENQEYKTNKVIELSSNSTDDEYPSAKCVYDIVGNIEAVLAAMDSGSGV